MPANVQTEVELKHVAGRWIVERRPQVKRIPAWKYRQREMAWLFTKHLVVNHAAKTRSFANDSRTGEKLANDVVSHPAVGTMLNLF